MDTEQLEALADALMRRRDDLVAAQIAALSEFPHYREVLEAELRVSCDRNVVRAVAILRGSDHLPPGIIEDERRSGIKRAQQGIPASVVLEAYRRVVGILRDAYLEEATASEIPLEATLLGMRRLWELTDHFSSALVSSRHEADLDLARRSEQQRIDFIRGALDGSDPPPPHLRYGVLETEDYWIVRGRARDGDNTALTIAIEQAGRTADFSPLVTSMGQDVVGIVGTLPAGVDDQPGIVAVAGPVRADRFPNAFSEASRLLHAAWGFHQSGLVDQVRLGLRLAVAERADLGDLYYARYVTPVLGGSPIGSDIIDSVRVFLDASRSIRESADRLCIHVNTLRYRLEKFEELTSCDLRSTEALVEVWWALNYATLTA